MDAAKIKEPELLAKDPALAEIVRRLVDAFQPLRVYLFGSKARGDDGPDSDYDIMVVVERDDRQPRHRSEQAYRVLHGTGTAADILVWTFEDFSRRLHMVASLPATIEREGRLIYAT